MIPTEQTFSRGESTYVKPDYFRFLMKHELFLDCTQGGLIQGPSMVEGGISLIGWNRQAEVFVAGQTEGWMYLLNCFAENDHQQEMTQKLVNNPLEELLFSPYSIPESTRVLTIEPRKVNGQWVTPVLFFGTNFMTNITKGSTKKNLTFLERINQQSWRKHAIDKKPVYTQSQTAFAVKWGPSHGEN